MFISIDHDELSSGFYTKMLMQVMGNTLSFRRGFCNIFFIGLGESNEIFY